MLRAAPAAGAVAMGLYLAHAADRAGGPRLLVAVGVFALAIIASALSELCPLRPAARSERDGGQHQRRHPVHTLLQVLTPPEMLGRVSAVNSVFIGSSNELGAFESGVAARVLGTVPAVVVGGVAALMMVGLTARFVPRLRQLGRIA